MLRFFRRKKKHSQGDSGSAQKGSSAAPPPPPFAVSAGSGRLPPLSAAPASPGRPAAEPTSITALHRIHEAQQLLTLRRNLLEKKIAAEEARARECAQRGNKRGALAALRQKRLLASNLEQAETSLLRLGEQQVALEGVAATAETVAALAAGAAASRATMQQLGPGQVDAIFDDMAETAAEAQQVQDALAVPPGAAAEVDEDELEAELRELEAAQLEEERLEAAAAAAAAPPREAKPAQAAPAAVPALPATPTARPQQQARQAQRQQAGPEKEQERIEGEDAQLAA